MKLPLTKMGEAVGGTRLGQKTEAQFGHVKFEVPIFPDTHLGHEPTSGVGPGWKYVGSQQQMDDI